MKIKDLVELIYLSMDFNCKFSNWDFHIYDKKNLKKNVNIFISDFINFNDWLNLDVTFDKDKKQYETKSLNLIKQDYFFNNYKTTKFIFLG